MNIGKLQEAALSLNFAIERDILNLESNCFWNCWILNWASIPLSSIHDLWSSGFEVFTTSQAGSTNFTDGRLLLIFLTVMVESQLMNCKSPSDASPTLALAIHQIQIPLKQCLTVTNQMECANVHCSRQRSRVIVFQDLSFQVLTTHSWIFMTYFFQQAMLMNPHSSTTGDSKNDNDDWTHQQSQRPKSKVVCLPNLDVSQCESWT
jgi:hypothetical protein